MKPVRAGRRRRASGSLLKTAQRRISASFWTPGHLVAHWLMHHVKLDSFPFSGVWMTVVFWWAQRENRLKSNLNTPLIAKWISGCGAQRLWEAAVTVPGSYWKKNCWFVPKYKFGMCFNQSGISPNVLCIPFTPVRKRKWTIDNCTTTALSWPLTPSTLLRFTLSSNTPLSTQKHINGTSHEWECVEKSRAESQPEVSPRAPGLFLAVQKTI